MSNITNSSTDMKTIPIEPTEGSARKEIQKKVTKLELDSQEEQLDKLYETISLYKNSREWEKYLNHNILLLSKAIKWKNVKYRIAGNGGIGIYYIQKGQLDKSILYFKESLAIAKKENREEGIYSSLISMGLNYSRLGNYELALRCYMELYTLNEMNLHKLKNQLQKIQILASIGRMYVLLENEEKALTYFEEAKTNMQNPAIKSDISIENQLLVWDGLGKVYKHLGLYDLALDCFSQFGNLSKQKTRGQERALYIYNANIGGLHLATKALDKALYYFQESLKYIEKTDAFFYTTQGEIGECYTEMGEYQTALTYYEKALEGEEKISKSNLLQFYKLIQKNYLALEEYKLAYEFLQKYTQLKEGIMGSKTRYVIAGLEKKLETEREEKEKIASKIKALRAQINPHFIFNTLNSIQSYIAQNQSKDAQRFLASFASLMRQTLENSDEALVTVEDEVHFIETYLTLERLRFEQKFDFNIKIDEEIEIEALLMPPMLLQPYFENAILHGIQPKEGKGKVLLELIEEEDYLRFIIADNGIGRSASAIQKKKHKSQHKSMGTRIQTDRLKALNSFYKRPIEVQISDIINKLGEICGTKIELKIPIWEA